MIALLALLLACPGVGTPRSAAHTLGAELARYCIPAGALADAHFEITGYASESRWPTFVIAYYLNNGTEVLADELHVRSFDRTTGESRHAILGPTMHGYGPATRITRGPESWYLDVAGGPARTINVPSRDGAKPVEIKPGPSLLVLDGDLGIRRKYSGSLVAVLADGRGLFQGRDLSAGLRLHSPHTNSDRRLFPSTGQMMPVRPGISDFEQVDDTTIRFRVIEVLNLSRSGEPERPGSERSVTIVCKLTGFGSCEKADK
jgi:hypothetical protein